MFSFPRSYVKDISGTLETIYKRMNECEIADKYESPTVLLYEYKAVGKAIRRHLEKLRTGGEVV